MGQSRERGVALEGIMDEAVELREGYRATSKKREPRGVTVHEAKNGTPESGIQTL